MKKALYYVAMLGIGMTGGYFGSAALTPTHHSKAPVIDTRLLPAEGFGRPHTITGGF